MFPISVYSPAIMKEDSYGRLAYELVAGLSPHPVNLITMYGGAMRYPVTGGFLLGYPDKFHKYGVLANSGVRVAITMFESTRIPESWIAPLNACNAVIVPAKFLEKVFRDCGVTVPIHVIPLGISAAYEPIVRGSANPYTFLTIGDRGLRKGWDSVLFAFVEAFGASDDVRLIIKARPGSMNVTFTNRNVTVIEEDYTDEQMCDLFGRAHCMAFMGREGWGLPPREFAKTGGLALALNWGGLADDIEQWGYPVNAWELVPAWEHDPVLEGNNGNWAQVDEKQLAQMMRFVANNRAEMALRGMAASYAVSRLYSWERFAKSCLAVYEAESAKVYGNHRTAEGATPS